MHGSAALPGVWTLIMIHARSRLIILILIRRPTYRALLHTYARKCSAAVQGEEKGPVCLLLEERDHHPYNYQSNVPALRRVDCVAYGV